MSTSADIYGLNDPPVIDVDLHTRTPLSEWLADDLGLRAWLRERRHETPGWLVSTIVHLAIFLLVMSTTAPWGSTRSGHAGGTIIELTFGMADRDQPAQDTQFSITPQVSETASESKTAGESSEGTDLTQARAMATASASDAAGETSDTSDRSFRVSRYAALLNRRPPALGSKAVKLYGVQPIGDEQLEPEQQEFDRIVDDFIAYDVGKLRGSAGRAARQRFAELGAESVPALVRGLNRAAGIHASCPVGVIASKLIMTLRSASDPSLRQYAVDHLGAGVPVDAPHYERIVALRNSWLNAPGMPPNVAQIVERLESRQEGELMELMLALSGAPSDTLVAALRSGDEYLAAAASLAIVQSSQAWDNQQRGQLRAALLHLRSQAANPQVRTLASDAASAVR